MVARPARAGSRRDRAPVNGFGASARPGGVQPLGYLDVSAAGMPANRAGRAHRIARVRVSGRGPYASRVELNPIPENLRGDGQRDRRAPAPFRVGAAKLIGVWDRQGPIRRFQSGA